MINSYEEQDQNKEIYEKELEQLQFWKEAWKEEKA